MCLQQPCHWPCVRHCRCCPESSTTTQTQAAKSERKLAQFGKGIAAGRAVCIRAAAETDAMAYACADSARQCPHVVNYSSLIGIVSLTAAACRSLQQDYSVDSKSRLLQLCPRAQNEALLATETRRRAARGHIGVCLSCTNARVPPSQKPHGCPLQQRHWHVEPRRSCIMRHLLDTMSPKQRAINYCWFASCHCYCSNGPTPPVALLPRAHA